MPARRLSAPGPSRAGAVAAAIVTVLAPAVDAAPPPPPELPAPPAPARARQPAPPAGEFAVSHYDLELELDRAHQRVVGRERLRLRSAIDGLAAVAFPRHGLVVSSVTSAAGAPLTYACPGDRIEIRLPAPLARGAQLSIAVTYEAIAPKGMVFRPDYVYTAFDTCHWMLCRDRPDDKATLTLILPVPDGEIAVANGAPAGRPKRDGAGARQVWSETVPSSPYLFGFAIGRFTWTDPSLRR